MMALRVRSAAVVIGSVVVLGLLGASPSGCASDMRVGVDDKDATPNLPFVPVDAGGDGSIDRPLCPTSECPVGTVTCETSSARCDIDITRDRDNCGACGAACPLDQHRDPFWGPPGPNLEVKFACEDSKCEMFCQGGFGDCDGIPDNGCEVALTSPENCGACGNTCAAGQPCVRGHCGCTAPEVQCGQRCADLKTEIDHCGQCNNTCMGGGPPPPHLNLQIECVNASCKRKCRAPFGDCDGDPDDGCEKDLSIPDPQNCGGCGVVCAPGEACDAVDDQTHQLICSCPAGLQRCSRGDDTYRCLDVLADPLNCGGCGIICTYEDTSFSRPVCRGGICGVVCREGRGDCNGFAGDGCEINLESDPLNCGACGHECDAAVGQPCVKGKCVETECGGGGSR